MEDTRSVNDDLRKVYSSDEEKMEVVLSDCESYPESTLNACLETTKRKKNDITISPESTLQKVNPSMTNIINDSSSKESIRLKKFASIKANKSLNENKSGGSRQSQSRNS